MAECWHVVLTLPRHREKPELSRLSALLAPWCSSTLVTAAKAALPLCEARQAQDDLHRRDAKIYSWSELQETRVGNRG